MIRLAPTRGRRVVNRDTAETLGKVKRVLVDPTSARAVALELSGTPSDRALVEWPDVAGFGPDAIVVPSGEVLRGPRDAREEAFVAGRSEVLGKRVLTDTGQLLGELKDVELEESSGDVRAFELDRDRRIDVRRLVAVGPYAVIIPTPESSPER
jgi:sporulation protein YlmC with PRC-barrel domain